MALDTCLSPVRAEQTVADVGQRRAGALQIMTEMGINHCCGAHLTLREAAAAAGVSLDALLAALNEPRRTPA
jgi:iron-sulfur cluster repair protein YtfE (RIC family)